MSIRLADIINELLVDAMTAAAKVVIAAGSSFADEQPPQSPPDRISLFGPKAPPPAAPPPPTPGGGGGMGTGAAGAGDDYTTYTDGAGLTDEKLSELITRIFASNQAARDRISAILADIRVRQYQIGPELGDPASLQAFQQFIDQKFAEIQRILTDTQVDAKTQAAVLEALADEYRNSGPQTDGSGADSPGTGSGADPGAADPGTGVGADPGGAGTDPLLDPLVGMGPLGGMGLDPLAALGPALAGLGTLPGAAGGLPGAGMGLDALGPALGSLGQLAGLAGGFTDRAPAGSRPGDGFTDQPADHADRDPHPESPADALKDTPDDQDGPDTESAGDPAAAPAEPTPPQAAPASTSAPDTPADAGRDVTMPDGSIVTAGDDKSAAAMRAVLSGSSVTDAFKAVGVQLPPPGTPVTAPVDPARLEPGSLGNFETREPVMAMGNGKIWMDGQLQPIGALGSTSDFLGWSKPPTAATTPAAPAAAPPAPAAAT